MGTLVICFSQCSTYKWQWKHLTPRSYCFSTEDTLLFGRRDAHNLYWFVSTWMWHEMNTDYLHLPTGICTEGSCLLFSNCLLNSLCFHSHFRYVFSMFWSPEREIHCYSHLFSSLAKETAEEEPELALMRRAVGRETGLCYNKPARTESAFVTASKSMKNKQTPIKTSYPGYFAGRQKYWWWFWDLSHKDDDCKLLSAPRARGAAPARVDCAPCLVMSTNVTLKGRDSFLPSYRGNRNSCKKDKEQIQNSWWL